MGCDVSSVCDPVTNSYQNLKDPKLLYQIDQAMWSPLNMDQPLPLLLVVSRHINNGHNPGLFFIYFRSFQTNNTIFATNQCEKMSIAGIRTHNLSSMSRHP